MSDLKKLQLGRAVTKLLCATVPRDGCHVICSDRVLRNVRCEEYLLKNNIKHRDTSMKRELSWEIQR